MDKLGIKTTLYDVLGYIIPGILFIMGMYVMYMRGNSSDILSVLKELVDVKSGVVFATGVILCSYLLGHAISSIGSLIFENRWVKSLFKKKVLRWFYKINEDFEGEKHKDRFKKLLGNDAVFCFRSVVAYSEENTKIAYDTAFVFLSIYGLSRNAVTVMLLLFLSHCTIFNDVWNLSFCVIFWVCFVALLHNYFRFKQYYIAQIYASLSSFRNKD